MKGFGAILIKNKYNLTAHYFKNFLAQDQLDFLEYSELRKSFKRVSTLINLGSFGSFK